MNRRIRFGLIFVGPRPAVDGGFLRDLGIRHIEGCSLKNRHYVLFTLKRARRSRDILNAVEAQNRLNGRGAQTDLEEELMLASDGLLIDGASTIVLVPVNGMTKKDGDGGEGGTSALPAASDQSSVFVAVFDKGHAFQSHEIFRVIYTAKLVGAQVQAPPVIDEFGAPMALPFIGLDGDSSNLPSDYWDWTAAGAPESAASGSGRGGKRVVYELSTDLVEASVKSSSSKRVSLTLQGKGVVPLVDMENELFGISSGGEEISEVVRRAVGEGEAGVAGFSNVTRLDNAPAPVPVVCNLDASVVRMPSPTVGGLDEVAADDEAVFEAQDGNRSGTSPLHADAIISTAAPATKKGKSSSSSSRRQTAATSARRRSPGGTQGKTSGATPIAPAVAVDSVMLIRELAKARQETIRAKDQLIQILMARQSSGPS